MGSIKRGSTVASNDNGTLEHVDGSSTYIGTATMPDGKVITKRFRDSSRDIDAVTLRWQAWQKKAWDKEDAMEREKIRVEEDISEKEADVVSTKLACPLLGGKPCLDVKCAFMHPVNERCAIALLGTSVWYMAENFARLDNTDALELIAISVDGLKAAQPMLKNEPRLQSRARAGVDGFFEGKSFLHFVNVHSKSVHQQYKAYCKAHGYDLQDILSETEIAHEILSRYGELDAELMRGGRIFVPRSA